MDPRVSQLRAILDELTARPADIRQDVLPELAALAQQIAKKATDEFVQRLLWVYRDGA